MGVAGSEQPGVTSNPLGEGTEEPASLPGAGVPAISPPSAACASIAEPACRKDAACFWSNEGGGGACRRATGVCEGRQTKRLCGQRAAKCSWKPARRVCESKPAGAGGAQGGAGTQAQVPVGAPEPETEPEGATDTTPTVPLTSGDSAALGGGPSPPGDTAAPGEETEDYSPDYDYLLDDPLPDESVVGTGGGMLSPVSGAEVTAPDEDGEPELPGGTDAVDAVPATPGWPWSWPWTPTPETPEPPSVTSSGGPSSDEGPATGPGVPGPDSSSSPPEGADPEDYAFDYDYVSSEPVAGSDGDMAAPGSENGPQDGAGTAQGVIPNGEETESSGDFEGSGEEFDYNGNGGSPAEAVPGGSSTLPDGVPGGVFNGSEEETTRPPTSGACAGRAESTCRTDAACFWSNEGGGGACRRATGECEGRQTKRLCGFRAWRCSWKPARRVCEPKPIGTGGADGDVGAQVPGLEDSPGAVVVPVPGGTGAPGSPESPSAPGSAGMVPDGSSEGGDGEQETASGEGSLLPGGEPADNTPGSGPVASTGVPPSGDLRCTGNVKEVCRQDPGCSWKPRRGGCVLAEAVSKNGAGDSQEFSMPGASATPFADYDYGEDYDYASEPQQPVPMPGPSPSSPTAPLPETTPPASALAGGVTPSGSPRADGDYFEEYDYSPEQMDYSYGDYSDEDYSRTDDSSTDYSAAGNGRDSVQPVGDYSYGDYGDYGVGNQDYGDYGDYGAANRSVGDKGVSPLILGIVAGVSLLSLLVAVGGIAWMCAARRRRNRGAPSHGLPAFAGPLKRNVVDAEKAREGPGVSQPIVAGGGAGGLMNFFSRRRGNLNSVTAAHSGPDSLPRGGVGARLVGRQDGVPIRVQVAPPEADEGYHAPLSPSPSV